MKIIIATTFREFQGTDNDKIQYMFLESIKQQTFSDYILTVTTFGEKNVETSVRSVIGDKCVFRDVKIPEGHRFSLTDVVLTGVEIAEATPGPCIFIWTTCDVILESSFFAVLNKVYEFGISGIVHPNIVYSTLADLQNRNGTVWRLDGGIDLLFFDAEILKKAKNDIREFRFYDWGAFEWFLVAIGRRYARSRINLFPKTKIKKIFNNRALTNENLDYFKRCLDLNNPVLYRYLDKYSLVKRYEDIWGFACHKSFKLYGFSALHWWKYRKFRMFHPKRLDSPLKKFLAHLAHILFANEQVRYRK